MEEKIKDFKIHKALESNQHYIFSQFGGVYLQRDGDTRTSCVKGWFDGEEEAQKCLDKYLGENTLNPPKGMEQLPKLPDGYEYVDRGWGWKSNKPVSYICFNRKINRWDDVIDIEYKIQTCGSENCYYLEIVKK